MTGKKFQTILIFIQEVVRLTETAQNQPKKNVCIFHCQKLLGLIYPRSSQNGLWRFRENCHTIFIFVVEDETLVLKEAT